MTAGRPPPVEAQELFEEIDSDDIEPLNPPVQLRPKGFNDKTEVGRPPADGDKVLTISVNDDIYAALKSVAERNNLPVGSLVREVLEGWVKYK